MGDTESKITQNKVATRAYKEALSLIVTDPRKIKSSMQHKALAMMCCPIERPPFRYEPGTTVQTAGSVIEQEAYDFFEQNGHIPTDWELTQRCQLIIGRTSTSHATYARDSAGLKPVDETKLNVAPHNPLTDMTDEQLVLLKQLEENQEEFQKFLEAKNGSNGN